MNQKKFAKENTGTRMLDKNAPFAIREAFNLLRTNLMYTMTDDQKGCPVYAITSISENAGKSTVISNLALAFSNLDKKVLLVDGDMRCPALYRFYDLDMRKPGLSELISGIENDVIVKEIRPNLDLITSGRIPPNPSELISSPRFLELLSGWRREYDIIFIDFPPVGIVADSITISNEITGYLFAVRAGKSSAKAVNSAIDSMEQIGAKIVGVVLNDYNIKGSKKYRYNHSRYFKQTMSRYEKSAMEHSADHQTEGTEKE